MGQIPYHRLCLVIFFACQVYRESSHEPFHARWYHLDYVPKPAIDSKPLGYHWGLHARGWKNPLWDGRLR